MSNDDNDFEPNLFRPNKFLLDDECEQQPGLYAEAADALADAKEALARKEAQKEVVRAETELKIRRDPARYNINKVTDKVIKASVEVHPDVQKIIKLVIKAQHRVDILSGHCRALEHKKQSIEDLVKLEARDYFSKPSPKLNEKEQENLKRRKRGKVRKSL